MSTEHDPNAPPAPPKPALKRSVLIVGGVVAVIGVGAAAWFLMRGPGPIAPGAPASPAGVGDVEGLPDVSTPQALDVIDGPPRPAIVVEVIAPKRVIPALLEDPWLVRNAATPLGRGFLGGWAAFFGTRGEHLRAPFSGTLLAFFSGSFLQSPFRLVTFAGPHAPGAPVFIQEDPPAAVGAAFDALSTLASRGTFTANRCPGDPEPAATEPAGAQAAGPEDAGGANVAAAPRFAIERWLVADQALFAARDGARVVLARDPRAALLGLCVDRAQLAIPPTDGADLQIAFVADGLGREVEALSHALGFARLPVLAFSAKDGHLLPLGFAGDLAAPGRLARAAFPEAMLRTIPADTPVMLGLAPVLPGALTIEALGAHLRDPKPGVERTIALLFWPHGAANAPTDVAFLWSKIEDEPALARFFAGPNTMFQKIVCGQLAFASTPARLEALEATCRAARPNFLSLTPSETARLKAPTSLLLSVQLGRLTSALTLEAYLDESTKPGQPSRPAPAALEAARRELEALPHLIFSGAADGSRLIPGGIGS